MPWKRNRFQKLKVYQLARNSSSSINNFYNCLNTNTVNAKKVELGQVNLFFSPTCFGPAGPSSEKTTSIIRTY
jgi:hypothetical protein